jgi:hypothetical protein
MKIAIGAAACLAAAAAAAQPLEPAMCGVRNTLWVEHYRARLYLPKGASLEAVGDPAKPKVLRMQMLSTFLMPPEIPSKWREALQPVLDGETMKRLQESYGRLREGDTVVVSYQPRWGLALQVNERTVATLEGHRAIDALLAAWADDGPLQKKLARTASRNRCA